MYKKQGCRMAALFILLAFYTAYFSASTELGRSPPDIPQLLEECHDIVDYFTESDGVVVPTLDEITTLFSMLV